MGTYPGEGFATWQPKIQSTEGKERPVYGPMPRRWVRQCRLVHHCLATAHKRGRRETKPISSPYPTRFS